MPNQPQAFTPAKLKRNILHRPEFAWPKAFIFSADFTNFHR
jgi:hypothetical protein